MSNHVPPPAPGSGDSFEVKEHKGSLIAVEVLGTQLDIETKFGPKDAIRCNLAVLDGQGKGDEYTDTLLFPSAIFGQLKTCIGQRVLARIGQGENKKGNPPWLLLNPSEADVQILERYDAYKATQVAAQSAPF